MPISNIVAYHRPADLDTALRLLREGGGKVAPLAGGTALVGIPPRELEEVVDLQDVGLDWIREEEAGVLSLGATTTLEALVEHEVARRYGEGILASAARYAAGSVIRTRATVGGTVMARAGSDLAAALLALGAEVVVRGAATEQVSLDSFWQGVAREGRSPLLLTEVRLPPLPEGARVRLERIARTPMDQPILSIVAVTAPGVARVAASGLAERPLLLLDHEGELEGWEQALSNELDPLDVRSDHLASAEYRRAMAPILARRALGQ